MANRVRKHMINFYVDDDELAAIRLKMSKMNMTNQSLYMRKMALEGRIIRVDYSVFQQFITAFTALTGQPESASHFIEAVLVDLLVFSIV